VTVIFGDRQTAWDADSLRLIRERYARPLEFSIPGLYPIPPIPCANPRCSNIRIRKRTRRGLFEGLRGAHDLCASCYDRHRRAGFPATGPPDPMSEEERLERSRNAERKPPAPIRSRLQAGDYGYRPSVGTAKIGEAA
jgi:hypothetical protein